MAYPPILSLSTINLVIGLSALAFMAWVLWTFKWYILGGCAFISILNVGVERITGKDFLSTWTKTK